LEKIVLDRERTELIKRIIAEIPPELGLARIEFEGPTIVIYIKNREKILQHMDLVRNIAKKVRKRIVLRVVEEARLDPREARKKILEIVPKDSGVDPNGIEFDPVFGEVLIRAEKPGLIVGRGHYIRHFILAETGWRPVPIRSAGVESRVISSVYSILLSNSEYRMRFLKYLGERIHRDVIFKNNYVRITALGGFMEVGRSAILIETRESRVLLDFGINVGASTPDKAYPVVDIEQFNLSELDAVIVTHAHLDHVGLVPLLYKYGYRGPVYVTRPTRELVVVMLKDFLEVAKRSGAHVPYTEKDVVTMLLHTIALDYDEVTDVAPDMKLTFYNAGHILGSGIAHIHVGMGLHNIVYTGDLKYADTRLLDKAHNVFHRVETLIIESTYGATAQPSRSEAEQQLITVINRAVERKGAVLIPVFAVGRGQEIMLVLKEAIDSKLLPPINIYIDGLVNEVTTIHYSYPEFLGKSLREGLFKGENPFKSEYVHPIDPREPKPDILEDKPCVILATSGMLNGGPAVEYLRLMASDPRNALVFVGYQAEGTLGRMIKDGLRELNTVVDNKLEVVKINMEVYSIEGFSGHSDQSELVKYVMEIKPKPKNIILNHGEPTATTTLAKLLSKWLRSVEGYSGVSIYTPYILDSLNLTARR